jgi:mono/diheme cytochrome c family protein
LTQKGGQSVLQPAEAGYRQIIYFNAGVRSAESRQDGLVPASAKQMKSPVALTAANIASGRSLFNQKCIACHGENGKSQTEFSSFMTVNPVDLTGPKARALTEGEVFSIIVNGAGSSGMPAFKGRVSDESLWQITLYVKQMSRPQTTGNQNTIVAAPSSPPTQKAPAAAEQRYQLKGKVVSIDRESQEVMIEHEEIANYMGAMTMPFPLKDRNVLGKLKKDDLIEATLVVDRNGWRLENVVIK